MLLEVVDLLVEGVDVGEAGLVPDLLAQCARQALFELPDTAGESGGAFVGGRAGRRANEWDVLWRDDDDAFLSGPCARREPQGGAPALRGEHACLVHAW